MRIKWFSIVRVTGLLLVLLYHFFLKGFSGGFVGVDVFFTFSGFLITSLLLDEYTRNQTIDILGFFKRRLYRIAPPLVLMILLVTPLALLVRGDFLASIGSQIVASLGFVTNWFEMMLGNGYENQYTPHLFVHTWSLAVEVHFYILWGLAVWGLTKITKSIGQLRGFVFLISSAVFLLSFLSMFISSFFVESFSTIYFSSWTHIFPFFLGTVLASLVGVQFPSKAFKKLHQVWNMKESLYCLGGGAGLLLLLTFLLKFDNIWTYLLGFLLASLAATSMILGARLLHEETPDIEEPAILTFFSDISYSIYLFHWPLYIIFSQLFTNNLLAVLLTTFFSILLSAISFYILEPYIAGKSISVFKLDLDLNPYKKWFLGTFALLSLTTMIISLTAPKVGSFEKEMQISNLQQADSQMLATRNAAENATASDYNIKAGTTIFGDSVTVRASSAIQEILPQAQIDGAVSRNLSELSKLIQLYKNSNTLKQDVVVALGTNTVDNYQELLDKLISEFPKGHHLIFVTPYNGNFGQTDSIAYQTGEYEKELAKKYDYITIADWYQASIANPNIWANTDLVHFNLEAGGGELFAKTLQTALTEAAKKPIKK
ncbi:acyltransferase [Streptococcus gallolyticus]|nr:acyltransferase [Streptococcus gallolyticus]MBY5040159.1 acyltransferase [Streptococcus gallolyticus]